MSDSVRPHRWQPTRLPLPWDSASEPELSPSSRSAHPGVRPRLEGKQRTLLSSRVATRISWSPLSGLKGVQPPLPFGERTRDCSPRSMPGLNCPSQTPGVHSDSRRTRPSDFTFTFPFHAWEEEMATHSSVLAWRIPGTVEPGGLPSMGSHRVGHD